MTRRQRVASLEARLEARLKPLRGTPRWEPVIRMAYGMPVSAQDRADADACIAVLPESAKSEARRIVAAMTDADWDTMPTALRIAAQNRRHERQ